MSDDPLWTIAQIASIPAIPHPLPALPTYAEYMTAIGAGAAEVYAETGRVVDSLYLAADQYFYLAGLHGGFIQQLADMSIRTVKVIRLPVGCSYVGDLTSTDPLDGYVRLTEAAGSG